jgi:hypothetical protein
MERIHPLKVVACAYVSELATAIAALQDYHVGSIVVAVGG